MDAHVQFFQLEFQVEIQVEFCVFIWLLKERQVNLFDFGDFSQFTDEHRGRDSVGSSRHSKDSGHHGCLQGMDPPEADLFAGKMVRSVLETSSNDSREQHCLFRKQLGYSEEENTELQSSA
jgi:hypothetical protein